MPSTSPGPGDAPVPTPTTPSTFTQILPGAPTNSLQSLTTFVFRQKRYIAYISGCQLNLLSSPAHLVQAVAFNGHLLAVTAETGTGKIVVASRSEIWVLEPRTESWTKVSWQKSLLLRCEDAGNTTHWLSWGTEGELLVGGSRQMSLFNTLPSSRNHSPSDASSAQKRVEERKALWSMNLSSPIQYACFSPSGEIIASCGRYDRLVKIWRRLSHEEGLFDYTYLPHPGTVTHLEWRPSDRRLEEQSEDGVSGRHDEESEALYTLANDGILRVWVTSSLHDLDILALHTTVDLSSAIPQSPSLVAKNSSILEASTAPARYAFILPSDQFCNAVAASMPLENDEMSYSLEHLKEVSAKRPDVIVALDGLGRMSAWGLQSIGHKRRPDTPSDYSKQAFHISHAERLPLKFPQGVNARFDAWFEDGKFNILVHSFSGYIQWWRAGAHQFFPPSAAGPEHMEEVAYWSGHQVGPMACISGSSTGRKLLSCNTSREMALWSPCESGLVHNVAVNNSSDKILDMVMIDIDSVVVLEQSEDDACELGLSVRNTRGEPLVLEKYSLELGDEGAAWKLHVSASDSSHHIVVALNSNGRGITTNVVQERKDTFRLDNSVTISITPPDEDVVISHASAVLDSEQPGRVGFVCLTKPGSLLLHHLDLTNQTQPEPVLMATFESGIQDSCLLAAQNEFAAVVSPNRESLAIVNLRDGYVEQRRSMGGQIHQIVPAAKHSLIAVVYDSFVNILVQGRYKLFEEMPWVLVKQVSIASIGLVIDHVAWLGDGSLAIAAGNGVFMSSNNVPIKELYPDVQEAFDADTTSNATHELATLSHHLKKPLPIWHPSLVAHTVRHGHWGLASSILTNLTQKLKFWSEGDELHPHLDMAVEHLYNGQSVGEVHSMDEDMTNDLMQLLDEKDLPEVSASEQQRLKTVLQAMTYCSAHVNGLDNRALRFLFSWRLQLLRMDAKPLSNGTETNGLPQSRIALAPEMHWREIAFAYHSTSQQPLLDILIAHYDNKITWDIAQRLGLFAWLSDREALDRIFDALAQSAYRSTDPPDPINASLYFLALHKKPTLLGLWRIATWHREQRATMNFLRRDFTQLQNQTAAKKNAYALMGKKRFDYAAAFFLLADDAASATSLLASQCDDIMLAIAVARLYSGDESPVLRKLLRDRLVPQAREKGDRWLMSWCHSVLGEKDFAAESLVQPLDGVRTWRKDDPNTLTLYRHLRRTPSEYEYDAILRAARILRRMGLWLLALELVSQWEFKQPERTFGRKPMTEKPAVNGAHEDYPSLLEYTGNPEPQAELPSMLDGFASPPSAVSAVQNEKAAREAKAAALLKRLQTRKEEVPMMNEKKREPTQFKEPEASSLLDSFGF